MQYKFFTQAIGNYRIIYSYLAEQWPGRITEESYTFQFIPLDHPEGNVCHIDFELWIQTELSLNLDSIDY